MIFNKRKKEKIKQNILDNLTLCRLKGDLLAVEASIRDNAPKSEPEEEGGTFKRIFNGIINEINNAARTINTRELSTDKEKAKTAVNAFRAKYSENELRLSEDIEAFKKYIDKQLFKKDRDGLGRISFALMFALDDKGHEYQYPEESLEFVSEIIFDDHKRLGDLYARFKNNYISLDASTRSELKGVRKLFSTIALSLSPMRISGVSTFSNYVLNKLGLRDALKSMTPGEAGTTLAFYLTLLEEIIKADESKKKEAVDELLGKIDNIRADAEYKWFVEGDSIPDCQKKIEICDLAIARLGKILGT